MARLAPVGAALLAALAAWLSQGTIGFAGPDGARLAVLPVSVAALLVAVTAAIATYGFWRVGASMRPVALLAFLFLPWLPFPVPAAFLIWLTPFAVVVWIAVFLLIVASLPGKPRITLATPRPVAAACALVLFSASAWRASPMVPGGDEPHYLVITQSLLLDGDLTIEDVHRRGDYRAYYPGDLAPHVQRRGRNGQIYSVHAPGLPVLVAPAFAIGGYPAVVVFLVLLATAGSVLAWHLAWLATRRDDAAWFGWASVTLPVTAIFQSFTVYPDGAGGILALTGLWALLRADEESRTGATRAMPWLCHGIALALLPWFHSRFAVIAGGFGALVLLRLSTTKNATAKAVAFLSVPAVSAILWVGYFIAIYGSPDPSAPYGPGEIGSFAFVPGGLGGLLFDQRFGLIAYAPVVAVSFVGLGWMLARPEWRRLGLELLFVVVPYLLTVTHFAMWWGGWSPPARFFAAMLPLFAVPGAVAWSTIEGRASRAVASAALVLTATASLIVVGIDRGRLAFNTREAPALWLEWLGRVADLTTAAPLWARDTDMPLFRSILIWAGVLAVSWMVLRRAERAGYLRLPVQMQTVTIATLATAIMLAASVVWAFEGASGRTSVSSELQLLERLAAQPRVLALQLDGWSRIAARDVPSRLRIELTRRVSARPVGREAPPMFSLPPLPAGEYRLSVPQDASRGWMMVGIARDQFSLRTVQLPVPPIVLKFPLPVRGLVIGGDEDGRRTVRSLTLEPLRVLRPTERVTAEMARRAVRYGQSTVFFLDDRSFPEPEGFWVGGARDSTIVIQPDGVRPTAAVRLRNGPVENRVTLEAGEWQRVLPMAPGEEQEVDVPLDVRRGAAVLKLGASAGFRPSEHDPGSRDQRFLGVWIKVL
jgi:hypothetical protein